MNQTEFLRELGCYSHNNLFILDGFNSDFYLIFDTTYDPEISGSKDTCDICVQSVGVHPKESKSKYVLVVNASIDDIRRFMVGLGVSRFSMRTQKALRE